jgi:creatinine amidohydrolase
MTGRARAWWDLSTEAFSRLDMDGVVALLPVAAVEQHGPHLPVRVDAAINAGILARAAELLPEGAELLVLPALPIGKSNEHLAFPGTLTLSYETLARLWIEVGESVARSGCRRLILFNSHGGQPQLVDVVCRELRVRHAMLAVACTWFQTIDMSDLFGAEELGHGIHAGAVETSVMLHLHPGFVDMERAEDFRSSSIEIAAGNEVLRSEGKTGFGWQMQDLHPSGAAGDARAASAGKGREIVERAARALATLVGETARFPLSNLTQATRYGSGPS